MIRPRLLRSFASSLALSLALSLVFTTSARAQGAATESYKRHMENGVKLYADRNYPAAIAEFQAAYEERPNPSPLVNIALCDKELFHYPQAIAVLKKALAAHGDAMEATDKKAASDAITEMSGLLGKVTIDLSPATAKVSIDGEAVALAGPVLLGPGKHQITARADGYANAETPVTVVSGREQTVTLRLVAEKGQVTIEAPDSRTTISIDDEPAGNGRWSGLLSPGQHVVRMYGADGPSYGATIVVRAGVPLVVTKDQGGVPITIPHDEPGRRGLYVLAIGSMLFAATHPPDFPGGTVGIQKPDYGAGYGLRAGWQVNKIAAFELTYEHSSIYTYANSMPMDVNTPYYRIIANRVAAGLRLISAGETFRFVGSFGGGITADQVYFNLPSCPDNANATSAPCYLKAPTPNHVGVDAFALAEAALEIDIDRVLIDVGIEAQLQSTGNLETGGGRSVFGSLPLINGGPAIRVGYRFW